MLIPKYGAVVALCLTPFAATAQSLTGGEVSLGYSALTDSDLETEGVRLDGSVEMALSREFAVQFDLGYTEGDLFGLSGDTTTYAIHAVYHANEQASFGYYIGRENSDAGDSNYFGVEGGYEKDALQFAGYFGVNRADAYFGTAVGDVEVDATQYGLGMTYQLAGGAVLGANFDNTRLTDQFQLTRYGIGAGFEVTEQVLIEAEVGKLDAELAGFGADETYASVSATFNFGAGRGATFDRRDPIGQFGGF